MLERVRSWVVWWALCAALWLLLVDRTPTAELLAGAGVAAAGATVAVLIRGRRLVLLSPSPRWLPALVRPLAGLVGDLVPLTRVLVAQAQARRRGGARGTLTGLRYDAAGDPTHRTLTEALGSLAPNTIVVDVDERRGVLAA